MWKLRTMRAEGPDGRASGLPLSGTDDDRITRTGRRLRSYHLDELPQLLNVARGEMALLGPRPETPEFVDQTDERWTRVLSYPPGIAGPTQVIVSTWERELIGTENGGPAYVNTVLPVKLAIDTWYLRRSSPVNDALVAITLLRRFLPGTEAWTLKKRVFAEVPEANVVREYLKRQHQPSHWGRQRAESVSITEAHPIRPAPHRYVLSTELDGETVVYDTLHDHVHLFNLPATMVWNLCTGERSVDQIVAKLARSLEMDPEVIRPDVDQLIAELTSLRLLREAEPAASTTEVAEKAERIALLPRRHELGPYQALELPFRLTTDDEFLASTFSSAYTMLERQDPAASSELHRFDVAQRGAGHDRPTHYVVSFDNEVLFELPSRDGLLSLLASFINHQAAAVSSRYLLIHAAAVVGPPGTIVIPGSSRAGKSTLAAALVLDGWDYVTDEYVALNIESGTIVAYPRPLSLDLAGPILLRTPKLAGDQLRALCTGVAPISASALRHGVETEPAAITSIIVPDRRTEVPVGSTEMSIGDAVTSLAGNTLNMAGHGQRGLEALTGVAARARLVKLTYSDLDEAVAAVRQLSEMRLDEEIAPR